MLVHAEKGIKVAVIIREVEGVIDFNHKGFLFLLSQLLCQRRGGRRGDVQNVDNNDLGVPFLPDVKGIMNFQVDNERIRALQSLKRGMEQTALNRR